MKKSLQSLSPELALGIPQSVFSFLNFVLYFLLIYGFMSMPKLLQVKTVQHLALLIAKSSSIQIVLLSIYLMLWTTIIMKILKIRVSSPKTVIIVVIQKLRECAQNKNSAVFIHDPAFF